MTNSLFQGQAEKWLRESADNLDGYIAREEIIERFCEMFVRLRRPSQPSIGKTGGYKAFVLLQNS